MDYQTVIQTNPDFGDGRYTKDKTLGKICRDIIMSGKNILVSMDTRQKRTITVA